LDNINRGRIRNSNISSGDWDGVRADIIRDSNYIRELDIRGDIKFDLRECNISFRVYPL
jgi:hypothetical protein